MPSPSVSLRCHLRSLSSLIPILYSPICPVLLLIEPIQSFRFPVNALLHLSPTTLLNTTYCLMPSLWYLREATKNVQVVAKLRTRGKNTYSSLCWAGQASPDLFFPFHCLSHCRAVAMTPNINVWSGWDCKFRGSKLQVCTDIIHEQGSALLDVTTANG